VQLPTSCPVAGKSGLNGTILAFLTGLAILSPPLADAAQSSLNSLETVSPEAVGLSSDGLALATRTLQAHVDAGDIAGVVAAVVRDGKLVYLEALGSRDLNSAAAMPPDALFRIYSMTRPITALGILLLHDEGLLDVDDPVQKYLPEFAGQTVLRAPNASDASDRRPRRGEMTLEHLLTHTSGIGSRSSDLYREHSVHGWDQPLARVVKNVAAVPLFEDPGTRFRYGMSAEILGRVIEEVSGMSLEDFFQERIFGPLGMTDTVFHVDETRIGRLAPVYRRDAEGRLREFEMETIPVTERRALVSGGVGLVSSTLDFLRFAQLFLDEGVVNGRRLVSSEVIRMAVENAIPETLLPIGPAGYWAGSGWTRGGFAVVLDPSAYDHPVNPREFWWDGSAGTRFWIDPDENMITIVMAQVTPSGGNGFREGFKARVADAIVERRK